MKEYVYREHLRKPSKYFLLVMVFILSIVMEQGIISVIRSTGDDKLYYLIFFGIIILALLVVMGLEFLLLYFIMFRKFKNVSVQLSDIGIIYKNIKGTTFIQYEDIQAIQFPAIRYFGGWTKIKSNGQNIRLTVVLENIGEFINELKDILDEKGLSYVYDDKKLYNFRKTATYSDHSWERVYEKLKSLLIIYFICIVITIVYLGFINPYASQIIFTLMITLYPLCVSILAEIILGYKLSNNIKLKNQIAVIRNKEMENKIYKYTFIVEGVLILLILINSML